MLTLETLPHQIQSPATSTPSWWPSPICRDGRWASGSPGLLPRPRPGPRHRGLRLPAGRRRRHGRLCPATAFANWDTGYGDLHAVVDPQTVRPLPWLPGSVLVLCDLLTMDGEPVEVSPRRILRRQIERAAALGLEVKCATELEFYLFRDSFAEAAAKRWQGLVPHAEHDRGLPAAADLAATSTSSDGSATRCSRPASPSSSPRARPGAGQHEINVTYGGALEVADRHLVFKNGVKEIAAGVRPGRHLHGQVVDGQRRVLVPHPHQPVGRGLRAPL